MGMVLQPMIMARAFIVLKAKNWLKNGHAEAGIMAFLMNIS